MAVCLCFICYMPAYNRYIFRWCNLSDKTVRGLHIVEHLSELIVFHPSAIQSDIRNPTVEWVGDIATGRRLGQVLCAIRGRIDFGCDRQTDLCRPMFIGLSHVFINMVHFSCGMTAGLCGTVHINPDTFGFLVCTHRIQNQSQWRYEGSL